MSWWPCRNSLVVVKTPTVARCDGRQNGAAGFDASWCCLPLLYLSIPPSHCLLCLLRLLRLLCLSISLPSLSSLSLSVFSVSLCLLCLLRLLCLSLSSRGEPRGLGRARRRAARAALRRAAARARRRCGPLGRGVLHVRVRRARAQDRVRRRGVCVCVCVCRYGTVWNGMERQVSDAEVCDVVCACVCQLDAAASLSSLPPRRTPFFRRSIRVAMLLLRFSSWRPQMNGGRDGGGHRSCSWVLQPYA